MDYYTLFELFSMEAAKTLAFQLQKSSCPLSSIKDTENLEDINQIIQTFLPTKDGMVANTMGGGGLDGNVQTKKALA